MDKKKVIKLIESAINDNIDSISFGAVEHNESLRTANSILHDALMELSKPDWISVKDELPPYDEEVLVCNKNFPEEIYITSRSARYKNNFAFDK